MVINHELYHGSKNKFSEFKLSNRQEIKLLYEQNKSIETTENLVEVAKDNLLVKASNPVEAVKKIYNNNLQSAIQESFTSRECLKKKPSTF